MNSRVVAASCGYKMLKVKYEANSTQKAIGKPMISDTTCASTASKKRSLVIIPSPEHKKYRKMKFNIKFFFVLKCNSKIIK